MGKQQEVLPRKMSWKSTWIGKVDSWILEINFSANLSCDISACTWGNPSLHWKLPVNDYPQKVQKSSPPRRPTPLGTPCCWPELVKNFENPISRKEFEIKRQKQMHKYMTWLWMCVCMCVCICDCVRVYACIYECAYVFINVCVCVRIYICVCADVWMCVHIQMYIVWLVLNVFDCV